MREALDESTGTNCIRLALRTTLNAALSDLKAAAYDSSRHLLYVLGRTDQAVGWYHALGLRLTSIDTATGTTRVIADLPGLAAATRTSLAVSPTGTLVLANQVSGSVQVFELNVSGAKMTFAGYAAVSGQLEDDVIMPDSVRLPILTGSTHSIAAIPQVTLAAKTGASLLPDTDVDGVPEVLDDCPGTYDPAQTGCPSLVAGALYGAQGLTVANGVKVISTSATPALLVSGSTAVTTIGTDVQIGSVLSAGPVTLLDRSVASGSVTSAGAIRLVNGAQVVGAKVQNAKAALPALQFPSVTFPPSQGAISLEPDQKRSLEPGSFGVVSVKSRSVLTLAAGDYFVEALNVLEPQSVLVVDDSERRGPVRIFAKSGLVFRGRVTDISGDQPRLLIVYLGTSNALLEAPFNGTVIAPASKLVLATTPYPHVGAFFAKTLEVQANATVVYSPLPIPWLPR